MFFRSWLIPRAQVKHENIVNCREIVVGSKMDSIFLVMEFVEHDLKVGCEQNCCAHVRYFAPASQCAGQALLETMKHPFLEREVKTLLRQLLSGVQCLHDNWILHRKS